MAHVLITTLGRNWEIVPEILGWTNPDLVNLYAHHPSGEKLHALRHKYNIHPVDTLWIITTDEPEITRALDKLKDWRDRVGAHHIRFRLVRVQDVHDLSTLEDCQRMSEALHQVVFRGVLEAEPQGSLILSLTGGRKTMSSDMQAAAAFFGCRALVHVVGQDAKLKQLQNLDVKDLCAPLPKDLVDAITPVVVTDYKPSPLYHYQAPGEPPLRELLHQDLNEWPEANALWADRHLSIETTPLRDALQRRLNTASNLAANHASQLIQKDTSANFLALYSLPPEKIQHLQKVVVGACPKKENVERELTFLQELPKAELHCHLGGALDSEEMVEVARSVQDDLAQHRTSLEPWLNQWKSRLERQDPAQLGKSFNWKDLRRPIAGVPEPLAVAAFILLFESCPDQLDRLIYGSYLEDSRFVGVGFDQYEKLGDLQGSALLQNEKTLRTACRILGRKAREHNVLHLEVRCSPKNYTRGGLSAEQVLDIISETLDEAGPESTGLLLIGSRHRNLNDLKETVQLAMNALDRQENLRAMLWGFDLAGDEKALAPEEVRRAFLPLMERCLHATIHAGEIADASSIWQAVYHLNAERIGHGLTLLEHPTLLQRFRDRRISLEMCPSSNCQIVGFRDHHLPGTQDLAAYPLAQYLRQGLRVTVNTDNPGISRTDFSREYHRAGRLTPGGLSVWDILLLIRNGFKAAFAGAPRRHELLRKAERQILNVLKKGLPWTAEKE